MLRSDPVRHAEPFPSPAATLTCLLVDDHALFREGMELLISRDFPRWRVCHADSVLQAANLLRERSHRPPEAVRLVLLDLGLPDAQGLDGLHRLREMRDLHTLPPVVVMSADDAPDTILSAIDAGAAGFIPKRADSDLMRLALHTVLGGSVFLPPRFTNEAPGHLPQEPDRQGLGTPMTTAPEDLGLSPRQADVLRLLVEGQSNKLIARALRITESTVKTHVEAIFQKLQVNSRTQAVVAAARLGVRLDLHQGGHPDDAAGR